MDRSTTLHADEYPHGTRSRYKQGCHCKDCRAANAAAVRYYATTTDVDRKVLRVVEAAGKLTPEHIEQLRRLLPPVPAGDGGGE